MINKSQIQNNLTQINNFYNNSKRPKATLYFSKLAILELCGWIEESMDDVIKTYSKRHLKKSDNLRLVENQIIKRTYSFEYGQHFRNMLIQVIGIINVEKLEDNLDKTKFDIMQSTLISLKECRDKQAHTHLKDVTINIDSPSITQTRFQNVYNGLKNIESCIRITKIWE